MPRITLDFHDDRKDAASALVSLREVGMNAEDIASIWEKPAGDDALPGSSETPISVYELTSGDGPTIHLSGWLAEAALEALASTRSVDLKSILGEQEIGDQVDRILRVIDGGGGVVAIRARDAHLHLHASS